MKTSPEGNWVIYDRETGKVIKTVQGTRRLAILNAEAGQWVVPGDGLPAPGGVVESRKVVRRGVAPRIKSYSELRQATILEAWPQDVQLEAFTEDAMGRPEKLEQLKTFIAKVKAEFPKDNT
jgi:hypothetical protein